MNIVFITGASYPRFDAVGNCAYQVQKCLAADFRISVVSYHSEPDRQDDDTVDGIWLYRFENKDIKQRAAALRSKSSLAALRHHILRIRGALRRLLSPVTVNQALVTAYRDTLNRLDPKPDVLVPLVFPFETVMAALAYKADHPDVMLMPYLFDDFVDSGSLHVLKLARALKRGRHLRLERRMLEDADAVLSMHPLRAHFEHYFPIGLRETITYLEHPLLIQPSAACVPRDDDGVTRLCYTGSLINKVRDPSYLLALLRAMRPAHTVQADFYVMGNAAGKIPTQTGRGSVQITNHGRVSKPEADAAVWNADILINLGDAQGKQVSGKVFEYMATGKPIAHLAYVSDDTVTRILAKYPLALCLVQDQCRFEENARLLSEFITTRRRDMLNFETVKTIYPEALPETSAMVFRRILISLKKNVLSRVGE